MTTARLILQSCPNEMLQGSDDQASKIRKRRNRTEETGWIFKKIIERRTCLRAMIAARSLRVKPAIIFGELRSLSRLRGETPWPVGRGLGFALRSAYTLSNISKYEINNESSVALVEGEDAEQ
ncbi:hypothetical protein BO79DRAFT_222454 [Aspergillus costaricaensis CBS 115574]|uniref:Uncharacterized protein n=1 Tax=Aspergillus costaricaensis CBS 115574 TaxID=1448317 RepID=A0ACD1I1D3_9EURO|nr:hypothetical protein BO79DRAFT_222454 [Aspergillus costaricaensis CBS 115574]RAK83576.1 hypothetical protein BO79DRAFT_222454 [Aspergillus costaricaensis CBS 115574]